MELNSIFDCIVSVTYNLIDNVTNFMCYDKSSRSIFEIIYFTSFEQHILQNTSRESCERTSQKFMTAVCIVYIVRSYLSCYPMLNRVRQCLWVASISSTFYQPTSMCKFGEIYRQRRWCAIEIKSSSIGLYQLLCHKSLW